jgi:nucleoside 2-deoxyribosyltransferase
MNELKHQKMSKVYIAAPLFSQAELDFNLSLKKILEPYFDIYLPQLDGTLFTDRVDRGSPLNTVSREIFLLDIKAIQECDVLLMVLDGRAVDEGAAFELGFGFALGKKCIGLQTDVRRLLPLGNNLMLNNALSLILESIEELSEWAISQS